jgi:Putative adhesin
MKTQTPEKQIREKKRYKVILILLVGLAAYSSAIRDLNNLKEMVGSVYEVASDWVDAGVITANAKRLSAEESFCSDSLLTQGAAGEFRWKGQVAPGLSVEIKGVNGDISAEAASGSEVEVVANRKAARSDPNSVNLKVVEHPGGVTICAVYPSDDPDNPNICEPGRGGRMSVRNNDVQVDFSVKVPAGVAFNGRTVNGEIRASSLGGNVISHTVNGAIQISTTGYAEANTVNGEISAKIGDANWPDSLEFKTVNGEIVLDLPATLNTEVKADTFNGEISTDFPLTLLGKMSRKHLSGRIGNGGRELVLKTLNGSIKLRRAG